MTIALLLYASINAGFILPSQRKNTGGLVAVATENIICGRSLSRITRFSEAYGLRNVAPSGTHMRERCASPRIIRFTLTRHRPGNDESRCDDLLTSQFHYT